MRKRNHVLFSSTHFMLQSRIRYIGKPILFKRQKDTHPTWLQMGMNDVCLFGTSMLCSILAAKSKVKKALIFNFEAIVLSSVTSAAELKPVAKYFGPMIYR